MTSNHFQSIENSISRSVRLKVDHLEVSRSSKKISASSLSIFLMTGLIVLSVIFIVSSIARSGFISYLSLILTDGDSVVEHWREYILSNATSFPYVGVIATLSTLLIAGILLKKIIIFYEYKDAVRRRMDLLSDQIDTNNNKKP